MPPVVVPQADTLSPLPEGIVVVLMASSARAALPYVFRQAGAVHVWHYTTAEQVLAHLRSGMRCGMVVLCTGPSTEPLVVSIRRCWGPSLMPVHICAGEHTVQRLLAAGATSVCTTPLDHRTARWMVWSAQRDATGD